MPDIIDWQQPRRRPRRLFFVVVVAILVVIIYSSRTALSYYIDSLWFASLGYEDVFRKTLGLQWAVFAAFLAVTFLFLYGWFLALRKAYQSDLPDDYRIEVGGQALHLPVARILHLLGLAASLVVAVLTAASLMAAWPTFAVYWYAQRTTSGAVDPIFGKSISFYLFTSARMAVHHGLAADPCGGRLRHRVLLRFCYWQHSNALRTPGRIYLTAVARVLHRVCLFLVDSRDARVYQPVRDAVRRAYDLWRRDLHGRTRHASGHARRLRRAHSWRRHRS